MKRRCPDCGKYAPSKAKVCKHCGADLRSFRRDRAMLAAIGLLALLFAGLVGGNALITRATQRATPDAVSEASQETEAPSPTPSARARLICYDCEKSGMKINLWEDPERSGVVASVPSGTLVEVLETQDYDGLVHYQVQTKGGDIGWVSERFVRTDSFVAVSETRQVTGPSSPTPRPKVRLICEECREIGMEINLWKDPARSGVVGSVPSRTLVEVLETQDYRGLLHYQVKTRDGIIGWVSELFVHPVSSP